MLVIITGASSGLGYALTKECLKQGYSVIGISRRKPDITNPNFKHYTLDLSNVDEVENCFNEISKNLNTNELSLINNAEASETFTNLSQAALQKFKIYLI